MIHSKYMEKTPTKYKINPAREHTRAIMMSIDKLSKSLETSRHNPLDDVSKFLVDLNVGLQKLLEISDRQITDGEPGVSVVGAELDGKNLVLTLSNKEKIEVGRVVGEDGFDGDDADENKIIQKILAQIPKPKPIDEEVLVKKLLSKIPKEERVTAQDIIKFIKDKKALSYDDLKGVPDIVQMIRKYTAHLEERIGRPVAGNNVISKMLDVDGSVNPTNGQVLVYSATKGKYVPGNQSGGGGGSSTETPSGAVDGSNTSFTVSNEPAWIIVDGITYFAGAGYTYGAGTLTIDTPPVSFIRSIY